MPVLPTTVNETQNYVLALGEALEGIRNAAFGLSDEQARCTPCRSDLSVSGILKHSTWVMVDQMGERKAEPGSQEGAMEFANSFVPNEEEDIQYLLQKFDQTRERYMQLMGSMDPDERAMAGPFPWVDIFEPVETSRRLFFSRALLEFSRHAGHADIIREQIDGATAMPLQFAVAGRSGNKYIQPWNPGNRRGNSAGD
ncbi:mycothiol transferase [Corynebacterium heidelbergense]|uniref:DinB family protein n=1 Tax=Corynebacterium heidelbergense TaxID=2055947 RepID=A0A364VBG9_9CORY|nr:DUF664 domain-containing protein [Corynebacterium heidelbergense]RAV33961.1 hypothetical protein CWC39_05685 [Corynebacterium heidelbergense]WCZ36304.1 hypothetical protein CHEID_03760 [Corynebacterium heidelbergense]